MEWQLTNFERRMAAKLMRLAVLATIAFAIVCAALLVYAEIDPEHFPMGGIPD